MCVSWIPELAKTRELLLSSAGCDVTSLLGKQQLKKLDRVRQTDLLVLAHSVPHEEKVDALRIFRRRCGAPVLSLLRPHSHALPGVDAAVEALDPEEFLEAVNEILSKRVRRWSVGCKHCDLMFKISLSVTKRKEFTLTCPYCTQTNDYQSDELTPQPEPPTPSSRA